MTKTIHNTASRTKRESVSDTVAITASDRGNTRVETGPVPAIYEAYIACESGLKRFLGRFLFRREDIEDMAQETFLRAFRAVDNKEMENPRAYLFRVAKNMALKELSRKSRQMTDYLEEAEDDFEEEASGLEDNFLAQQKVEAYCNAIATLPPQCRRVFLMRKVYGMSHKEISKAIGLSPSSIEKHIALGVEKFALWMEQNDV